MRPAKPLYFRGPADFRKWLEKHHDTKTEQFIGFYKKSSDKTGITYEEALDVALCFGWIDRVVRSVDADSYMHRFTPRKPASHWSNVNVRRFGELAAARQVASAGHAAFARRTPERTGKAAYEQPPAELTPAQMKRLKATPGESESHSTSARPGGNELLNGNRQRRNWIQWGRTAPCGV